MEDGDAAERATSPLGVVLFELGVHRLEEGSDERSLEGRAGDGSLVQNVADCTSR